jgi:hypothetical protein
MTKYHYPAVIMGLLLLSYAMFTRVPEAAADASTPYGAVSEYLAALANGDTRTLERLVEGGMKERSHRLLNDNAAYAGFLRDHYSGVVMKIEDLAPEGDGYVAVVRFDYPTSDSATTRFTLKDMAGEWKIVNEESL